MLLTHRNPHTGLTYAEDPAVFTRELNDEDSLTEAPEINLAQLRDEFRVK